MKRKRSGDFYDRPIRKKRRMMNTYPTQGVSKYFDSSLSATNVPEATSWAGAELDPAALTLFSPIPGTTISERVGNKCLVHKIAVRGIINNTALPDQADIVSSPAIRLILYADEQSNGTQSQAEELMQGGTSTELTFSGFQNIANFGRFRVFKDIVLNPRIVTAVTDGTNTSSQNTSQTPFKMVVKFKKPLVVKFNNTGGGTFADVVNNSIHLIGTKSSSAFAHTISYRSRVYYRDV